jgi:LmbE family N-acetylglucosaminyl deacetylase
MNTDKRRFSFTIYRLPFTVFKSFCVYLWLISLCLFAFPFQTNAQVRPVYDYGAIGLGQLLKRLNTTKSVMMIGAHPDDEDSALLAYLARGENARTAYLSLTRGDGGQNIIGSELFESLGVIRTEELLQARRLDGAQQFFTRAFDYGFSKTLMEAQQKWDEKIILCDTVRAIRAFRPLVVISRFSGTTADGHGQHQYAGYISPLAVKAAANGNQCVESGTPWQVLKFYIEQGFRTEAQPTLKINTGAYDYLLGRSYFEIAIEGRSQHQTQEQGGLELKGDQFSGLNLADSKVSGVEKEKSVFDGIDTSITGIPKLLNVADNEGLTNNLREAQTSAEKASKEFEPNAPQKLLTGLIKGLKSIKSGKQVSEVLALPVNSQIPDKKYAASSGILEQKEKEFTQAIKLASGIRLDALADKENIAPDESFQTTVKVFFPTEEKVKVKEIKLNAPHDWEVSKIEKPKETAQGFRRETANETAYFKVKVSTNEKPTQPYWLESERKSDLFVWQNDVNQSLPFQQPIVNAEIKFEIEGTEISLTQPVEYRFADDVRGEIRRDFNVVPKVALELDQNLVLVSGIEKPNDRELVLSITNNSAEPVNGTAKLNLPADWHAVSSSNSFNLKNKGDKTSVKFVITVPQNYKFGNYEVGSEIQANGETFTRTMNEISYPHIQTHRYYTEAKAKVDVLDLKVAPVKVGYIMGSGDNVPEAIKQIGLSVEMLNETELSSGDLSRFDTIVVGIRASQTRPDFVVNNQRLLDFVKNGGTLIVQYQRPDYIQQNLQPFAASMTDTQKTTAGTTARVVDENAKVTILDRTNPIFNFPNRITDADFQGWVQERNLYNFTTFDTKYTALLETHDAGELENKGGMVFAKIGKGNYIYNSYSFFRQLPNGVSGAYRIFANLLSLPNAGK